MIKANKTNHVCPIKIVHNSMRDNRILLLWLFQGQLMHAYLHVGLLRPCKSIAERTEIRFKQSKHCDLTLNINFDWFYKDWMLLSKQQAYPIWKKHSLKLYFIKFTTDKIRKKKNIHSLLIVGLNSLWAVWMCVI